MSERSATLPKVGDVWVLEDGRRFIVDYTTPLQTGITFGDGSRRGFNYTAALAKICEDGKRVVDGTLVPWPWEKDDPKHPTAEESVSLMEKLIENPIVVKASEVEVPQARTLLSEVMKAIKTSLPNRPPPFVIRNETTQDDVEQGRISFKIGLDPTQWPVFFGRSAGELRTSGLGFTIPEDVPDCATFGPNGFEWVEVDVKLVPVEGPE